jgi:hypothetical protein
LLAGLTGGMAEFCDVPDQVFFVDQFYVGSHGITSLFYEIEIYASHRTKTYT